jgi:hypothetical protein
MARTIPCRAQIAAPWQSRVGIVTTTGDTMSPDRSGLKHRHPQHRLDVGTWWVRLPWLGRDWLGLALVAGLVAGTWSQDAEAHTAAERETQQPISSSSSSSSSSRARKSAGTTVVQHAPNDGTLPHPRRSLCQAGTTDCVAVRVQQRSNAAVYTRYQPRFVGSIATLSPKLRHAMTGVSWRRGCPLSLDALRSVTVDHWRPDGSITRGQLIVAATVAPVVLRAFRHYFQARFPITTMAPVHRYGASDDRSMKADNTSAFNCRKMTGGSRWSEHAYGTAIDINPLRNPYVKGKLVLPASGRAWAKRSHVRPGMLVPGGPAVSFWRRAGWGWGGSWRTLQDYQHISKTGR